MAVTPKVGKCPPSFASSFSNACVATTVLKPKEGHCCVFCSYGDAPCPSIQQRASDETD